MIKITNEVVAQAEGATKCMLEDLAKLAKLATEDDLVYIRLAAKICGVTPSEIRAIIDYKVSDMSLLDYNRLSTLFQTWLAEDVDENEDDENEYEIGLDCLKDSISGCCQDCCAAPCDDCDNDQCVWNIQKEKELGDFIDNVNKSLSKDKKLDKTETLKAKKVFDTDYNKQVSDEYDEAAKKANIELFGTVSDLNSLPIGELKYLIYKNRWEKELDLNMINHRQTVLSFLYHKLEDKVAENLHRKHNVKESDIDALKKLRQSIKDKYNIMTTKETIDEVFKILKQFLD